MQLCRVEGTVISTRKHPSFNGWRFLICQPLDCDGRADGIPVVALDSLGAGIHQKVVVTSDGLAARRAVGDDLSPARMMTIAIVDEAEKEISRSEGATTA